jgi:putative membrane-bound dehydrogenase-like protein
LTRSKAEGPYDRASVLLEDLAKPKGVHAWRQGVLITAAPDVIYAEDTDGDGRADKTEVLFTGFKPGNPQLRVNGLRYGLDNWVYLANGWSAGVIKSTKTGKHLDLKGHDLRVRPDTGEMELVSGVSQFGREHDDFGRWFGTDNAHPLFHYRLEDAYLRRNPQVTYPDVKTQLLPLPLPPVFPKSPFARRYIGLDHHGHFTSACGINLYRDELLFPRDERIRALICEPVHNLVQHQVLTADGVTFKATRVDGEAGADFIAGEDPWFRPVMTRTGPDGAVWVVDMYRYMIEHPDWLNEEGKRALAPFYRDGAERGRIYRIYPKGTAPRMIARMDNMSTGQLVSSLESPSGYVRDRAQMMLVWRRDPAAVGLLEDVMRSSNNPLARLHALCTLAETSELRSPVLSRAFGDPNAAVRANALRVAEGQFGQSPDLLAEATKLTADANPFVRQQLARSLGQSEDPRAGAALGALAKAHGDELWPDLLSSGTPHYDALVDSAAAPSAQVATAFFDRVVEMATARGDRPALANLLGRVFPKNPDDRSAYRAAAVGDFLQTLSRGGRTLADWSLPADPLSRQIEGLRPYLDGARAAAADPALPADARRAHAQLLGYQPGRAEEDLKAIAALLVPQTPTAVSAALVRAAARTASPAVPEALLRNWASHSPDLRGQIADTLLPREPWALALAQSPAAKDLDFSRRQRLLNHSSFKVKDAAKAAFAQAALNLDRQKVIDAYAPALAASGDRKRGEAMFAEHCATCHRAGTAPVGHDIGPNLLTVRDWPRENLVAAILDPDRTVEPRYFAYTATLTDGTVYTGLLTADTSAGVTIKTLDDADHVLPRANLKSLASTERSLMPQGFEAAMTVEDLADLLAFIQPPSPAK